MAAKKKSVIEPIEGIEPADDMPEDARLSGKQADEMREQAEELAHKAAKGSKKAKPAVAASGGKLIVPPLKITKTIISIKEMSPLIVHRFGEKAKKMMRDKKMQVAKDKREACGR